MTLAYYNEIDPNAAAWLRELIKQGHIAEGDVDERSIVDVTAEDLAGYTQCHFFAGIGVWSYALRQAGWRDDEPVWTGSCPCQPFSSAGKGKGVDDERHLWPHFSRLIAECRPSNVFGEQVANKAGEGWFDIVQSSLEKENYASGLSVFPACGVGADHLRQRLYWVAHSTSERQQRQREYITPKHPKENPFREASGLVDAFRKEALPYVCSRHDEYSAKLGRIALKGFGNAIVAEQATAFIEAYMEIVNE